MTRFNKLSILTIAILALGAASCARLENAVMEQAMGAIAQNQIMLVRKEPPSFGRQRLESLAVTFPDMARFMKLKGEPEFLAETGGRQQRYFIFYYLKKRQAFACRTRDDNRAAVEFSGPYPITDKEFRLLDEFRRDPKRKVEW